MSKEFYLGEGAVEVWPRISNAPAMGLTFSDVYLAPGDPTIESGVITLESRSQPDLGVEFGPWRLRNPFISAPMDTVSDVEMIEFMAEAGGIGTLFRHQNDAEMLRKCRDLAGKDLPFVAAIGLKNAYEQARELKNVGVRMLLIDIANGGLESIPTAGKAIMDSFGIPVIAGNIARHMQAKTYKEHSIPWARVGIGPGAVCKTRVQTGIGVPQLSAIFDTSIPGLSVIADGGIRQPGDATRAIAAGAGMVMIGSMLAGTDESPGEIIEVEEKQMKRLRGQASASYMADHGLQINGTRTDEGVDVLIPYKGSVRKVLEELTGGLRSSMLYVGAKDLDEFYLKTQFIVTSPAGHSEGNPHILQQGNVYHYQGSQ